MGAQRRRGSGPLPRMEKTPIPADLADPSPEERELMGLGVIVAVLRRMTVEERWHAIDYVVSRYGHLVPDQWEPPEYTDVQAAELSGLLTESVMRGIRFGSYTLARVILDAGYRKAGR